MCDLNVELYGFRWYEKPPYCRLPNRVGGGLQGSQTSEIIEFSRGEEGQGYQFHLKKLMFLPTFL